jgi:hypothetical protein
MQRTCILGATQRALSRPSNSNFGESSAVRMFPLITGIDLNNPMKKTCTFGGALSFGAVGKNLDCLAVPPLISWFI